LIDWQVRVQNSSQFCTTNTHLYYSTSYNQFNSVTNHGL